jgi:hypothetical protein
MYIYDVEKYYLFDFHILFIEVFINIHPIKTKEYVPFKITFNIKYKKTQECHFKELNPSF